MMITQFLGSQVSLSVLYLGEHDGFLNISFKTILCKAVVDVNSIFIPKIYFE